MKKTSTGLEENIAGLLAYVLGWITGIVFLVIEKENKTVKFHAAQSLVWFLGLNVLQIILRFIPIIGWGISMIIGIIGLVTWIYLMVSAYQGKKVHMPLAGKIAEDIAKK